jgi:hypothetical protein
MSGRKEWGLTNAMIYHIDSTKTETFMRHDSIRSYQRTRGIEQDYELLPSVLTIKHLGNGWGTDGSVGGVRDKVPSNKPIR